MTASQVLEQPGVVQRKTPSGSGSQAIPVPHLESQIVLSNLTGAVDLRIIHRAALCCAVLRCADAVHTRLSLNTAALIGDLDAQHSVRRNGVRK